MRKFTVRAVPALGNHSVVDHLGDRQCWWELRCDVTGCSLSTLTTASELDSAGSPRLPYSRSA
jgi:hypothetical protein